MKLKTFTGSVDVFGKTIDVVFTPRIDPQNADFPIVQSTLGFQGLTIDEALKLIGLVTTDADEPQTPEPPKPRPAPQKVTIEKQQSQETQIQTQTSEETEQKKDDVFEQTLFEDEPPFDGGVVPSDAASSPSLLGEPPEKIIRSKQLKRVIAFIYDAGSPFNSEPDIAIPAIAEQLTVWKEKIPLLQRVREDVLSDRISRIYEVLSAD